MAEPYFIVSFDFDGVLAYGLKAKLKYAKEWFGVDLALNQTKETGFDALMRKLGKEETYRSLMTPLNEEHIMEFEVPDNCENVLTELYNQNCRFVVITSRIDHDYPYALAFIKEKFGDLIQYVHNTRNESKGAFVSRLKPRIHVDDDLSKLLQLQEYPVELVYYRQPENEGVEIGANEKGRIWEARSFEEVQIIITRIRKLHEYVCKKENIQNNWTNISRIYGALHSLSAKDMRDFLGE